MASWTLWQPLIPRYQLTTKEVTIEEVNTRPKTSPGSPRVPPSPRAKSAKVPSSPRRKIDKGISNGIKHQINNDERDSVRRGKATMYFTMASPVGSKHVDSRGVVIKPSFPVRRSSYIDTLKQQQRINSARQSIEDPSTASPRQKPSSPRYKKQKPVSQFPVTQLDQQVMSNYSSNHSHDLENPRPKTAASRLTPRQDSSISQAQKRVICKSAGASRDVKNISVNTIGIGDESPRLFLKNPLYKDPTSPRRYAVRKLDDATMFIDDDKIIFIKKKTTKNDVLLSQSCTEENNYIKHLRRLYLREPKDIAKLVKEPEVKKGNVIRERLEYELKTDHILDYYSRVDDKQDATLWAMAVQESRKAQKTPQTTPRSSSGFRRAESARKRQSQNASPPRSARNIEKEKERPLSARSLPYSNISSENVHMNHDSLSDWNVFLKLNTRSILHERQFYLQTPAVSVNSLNDNANSSHSEEPACDNHECRLCRLEREMESKRDTESMKQETVNGEKNSKRMGNKVYIQTGLQNNNEELECSNDTKNNAREDEEINDNEVRDTTKETKPKLFTVSTSTSDLEGAESEKVVEALQQKKINTTHLENGLSEIGETELPIKHSSHDVNGLVMNSSKTDTNCTDVSQNVSRTCHGELITEYTVNGPEIGNEDERGKLDSM